MAYKVFEDYNTDYKTMDSGPQVLQADGADRLELPDSTFVRDADMSRDGMDLVLETPEGTLVIENYFAQGQPPALVSPNGMQLTPELVNSFTHGGNQYAAAGNSQNDASPVGAIQEIKGEATVTRLDGTIENVGIGTPIFQGDIVETDEEGAVNITFVDNTTFAISEDARLAIDEYVFDPATQSGTSNFSVLKGVFVFTSGLIGRDDPDQVEIDTPSGSIGIRGTIIAGDVDAGEITVIEGAIVLHDFSGNSVTLATQFETAKFIPSENTIEHLGTLSAENVSGKFSSVSSVSGSMFASIQDSAAETGQDNTQDQPVMDADATGEETGATDGGSSDDTGAAAPGGEEPVDSTAVDGEPVLEGAPEGETTTQDAPMDGAEATMPDQGDSFMTSTDIIKGDTIDSPLIIDPVIQTGEMLNSGTATQTIGGTATTNDILPPPPPEDQPPLFHLEIERFAFLENMTTGAPIARITGINTEHTNLFLTGVSSNYYNLVQESPNSYLVHLNPGIQLNAERPYPLTVHASNDLLTQVIDKPVNLAIIDDDEPTVLTGAEPDELFTASDNNIWSHNFAIDFHDPEGQITHFQLVESIPTLESITGVDTVSFDSATGVMSITFDSAVINTTFPVTVHAKGDSGILETQNVSFETFAGTANGISATLLSGSDVYSSSGVVDNTITVISSNNKVFSDGGNDTINVNDTNNLVNAGHGADTITNSNINNDLVGGAGNDTFVVNNVQSDFYGGEDNDAFEISSGALAAMQSATPFLIDGGSQFDTLHLNSGGNLDFSLVDNNYIKNIEKIDADNSLTNSVINLKYSEVIAMTDEHNTLVIDMDASDGFTFVNDVNSNIFVNTGTNGDFNVFTDGTITLLVDTQGTTAGL